MDGKRRQCIQGPLVERIGIDHVVTASSTANWRAPVSARRIVGRDIVRHRPHTVGKPWHCSKERRHLPIDLLGNVGSFLEQLFRLIDIELRIGTQKFDELSESAVELHLPDDIFHFCPDSGDFLQSDFVNAIGCRIVQRGVITRQIFIVRFAVFQRRCTQGVASSRHVFVNEELQKPLVSGQYRIADYAGGLCTQAARVGISEMCRNIIKWRIENTICRLLNNWAGY